MLYSMEWLQQGRMFPPECEISRIKRYRENQALFESDHFDDPAFRHYDPLDLAPFDGYLTIYKKCAERIQRVIGNFEEVVSFPTLLNYQRLMSVKAADLVCGEPPMITGSKPEENEQILDVRDYVDFDEKLYSTVIDISRYGDAVWRYYKDDRGQFTFTCWNPIEWYPIVSQDGTRTIVKHCLAWRVNIQPDPQQSPIWNLHVQIHGCKPNEVGHYTHQIYEMGGDGKTIGKLISSTDVLTGLDVCAVRHVKAFSTSNTIYGYDDYMPIDSVLAEIMVRIGQISVILDKHADPNITGPVSMLHKDPNTGELVLQAGKFFAVSQGELKPEYMTWDGQLNAAFKEIEMLLNQLYILSEMGAALLGEQGGSGQAISGTAMRFKMVNPLAKVRRIANSLTRPVKEMFAVLTRDNLGDDSASATPVEYKNISVFWSDGLPDDPRENIENAKLATGATKMMPLKTAIREYFQRTDGEAQEWLNDIAQEAEASMELQRKFIQPQEKDPNHSGPQDGTGVNPYKNGSQTGLNKFKSDGNKKDGE